jgi:ATP-binding cassette subfamily B protein
MAQCRAACVFGGEVTAEHLVEAACVMGLPAKDWIIDGADAFDVSLSLPAIVSWHGHHFVVVERVTRAHVTLIDPAVGRRRLARELFDRFCSGVAVTFAHAASNSAREHSPFNTNCEAHGLLSPLRSLLREAFDSRQARWMAGLLIVSTIALQICSLALPVGLLLVVDHVLPHVVAPSLLWVMGTALLVVSAHVILRFVRSEALFQLRMDVEARWKHRALSRVFRMPWVAWRQWAASELLVRVGCFDGLPGYLVSQSIVVCLHVWFVIFSLLVVAVWSPVIAVVAMSCCLMQVGVAAWTSRRLWIGIRREVAADAEAQVFVMGMVRGLVDVKASRRGVWAIERWSLLAMRGMECSARRHFLGSMVDGVVSGMGFVLLLGLLVLGAHEVVAGRLTMAGMLAVEVVAAGALIPVGEVMRGLQQFLLARARFERLCRVLDAADEWGEGNREREGWR